MTNRPFILSITNVLEGQQQCKLCPMPAEFTARMLRDGTEDIVPFCATDVVPYLMQTLKLNGANLGSTAAFLGLILKTITVMESQDDPPRDLRVQ